MPRNYRGQEFIEDALSAQWISEFCETYGDENVVILPPPFRSPVELFSQQIHHELQQLKILADAVSILLGRMTDVSHVTVREAARIKRCSEKTIRNRIAKGIYRFEHVPATRENGIPLEDLFSGWLPFRRR